MTACRAFVCVLVGTVALLVGLVATAEPAYAATITVTTTTDTPNGYCPHTSQCTLRAAISMANAVSGTDTVTFKFPAGSGSTITVNSAMGPFPDINSSMTIQGPGAQRLTISGATRNRIFRVNSGITVTISGLTIQHGLADNGGGIWNFGGLTLSNVAVKNNEASTGGGIYNIGTVRVSGSITGNTASSQGGGIWNVGTLIGTNVTISGNGAGSQGGGLWTSVSGASLTHATVSSNSPGGNVVLSTGPTIQARNSIFVNGGCGAIVSLGNVLSDVQGCASNTALGDVYTTTPGLAPLAINAPGGTLTHALQPGSPAIDKVTVPLANPPAGFPANDCGTTVARDQRGVPRPQPGTGARCDIGAYELAGTTPLVEGLDLRTFDEDSPASTIDFWVDDPDGSAADLEVTATSSDQTILQDAKVVPGGSGADRTVRITPEANRHGAVVLTLNVSDGVNTSTITVPLIFAPVNDPPINTVPSAQTIDEDTPLVFSTTNGKTIAIVDDAVGGEVQVGVIAIGGTVTLSSMNDLTTVAGASGSSAVIVRGALAVVNAALNGLTFTPTPELTGAASLRLETNDLASGGSGVAFTDTDTVAITLQPVNDRPTISAIEDQELGLNGTTSTLSFTVGDAETAAGSLEVTATSSNTTLVPDINVQLGNNGAVRTIKVTAAPSQIGKSTIDVKVTDGVAEAHETFDVDVVAVNQAPSAVPDSYSTGAMQTLTVPAANGVLKNDTDIEASPLQADVVTGPAHGSLTLKPDGSFMYAPAASFAGTDSFTYRASDGALTSSPATVTIAVTGSHCAPRASVKVSTTVVDGKLQATVEALPLDGQTNNRLISVLFDKLDNAKVTVNGQPFAKDEKFTAPADTTRVVLLVERATAGQAATVRFTAMDVCGSWPSFVGGGAGAGF